MVAWNGIHTVLDRLWPLRDDVVKYPASELPIQACSLIPLTQEGRLANLLERP